ncbi:MAG TPA: hypothetical protein PKD49_01400 [Hyphomicrobium sp.]|nr:hypothetical protein [Hyphomicrobium sp.]
MIKTILAAGGLAIALAALGGCGASIPGMSTSALSPAPPQDDPTARALQVGSTSARAIKCGYNFDPVKLRTQFLAAEGAANPAGVDQVAKVYDTAFNGVSKAVASQGEAYCSQDKVAQIKAALTRHLAGDYTPPPRAPAADEGLFGSLGSTNSGDSEYAKKMQANPTLEH